MANKTKQNPSRGFAPDGLRRFRRWVAFLVIFFAATGILVGWQQAAQRAAQDLDWRAIMDPMLPDPGLTPADDVPTDRARHVSVGLYVERITEVAIRESHFRALLDVWFVWQGEPFDPTEHLIVIDGVIESIKPLESSSEGDRHYRRFQLEVEIAKTFHIHHFPLDRHFLVVAFEDGSAPREKLLWRPDLANSAVSSRAAVHGYRLGPLQAIEKPHSYKTTQGRPGLADGARATFSQARFGIVIARDSWGPFVKMFHALFVAVAIALLSCFIKPTDLDPRFGLGVGAVFAAVANSYLVGTLVPDTGEFSLADIVNLLGIVTILITLVESTVSLHLFDRCGEPEISRSLDRTSFCVIALGFTAAVGLILMGAAGRLWFSAPPALRPPPGPARSPGFRPSGGRCCRRDGNMVDIWEVRLTSSALQSVRELGFVHPAMVDESNPVDLSSRFPEVLFYVPEDLRGEPALVDHVGRS